MNFSKKMVMWLQKTHPAIYGVLLAAILSGIGFLVLNRDQDPEKYSLCKGGLDLERGGNLALPEVIKGSLGNGKRSCTLLEIPAALHAQYSEMQIEITILMPNLTPISLFSLSEMQSLDNQITIWEPGGRTFSDQIEARKRINPRRPALQKPDRQLFGLNVHHELGDINKENRILFYSENDKFLADCGATDLAQKVEDLLPGTLCKVTTESDGSELFSSYYIRLSQMGQWRNINKAVQVLISGFITRK